MDMLVLLASLVALGYIIFYMNTLTTKTEGYKSSCNTVLDTSTYAQKPYVTTETSRGDFEQDFIYQNEGSRDTDREAIDMAKRKFPFDWSQLPPDSSLFQAQQALFVKDHSTRASPFKDETYTNIDSVKVLPPDLEVEQSEEADELRSYEPTTKKVLNAVDDNSVNDMIQSIYGKKGFVARVAKKANNVYEIYEVIEKNPKIVWEDDIQASMQSNDLESKVNPNEMIVVPEAVGDAGLVPYGAGENTKFGRRKVNDYNPNLEGIFGPKMQWQQYG